MSTVAADELIVQLFVSHQRLSTKFLGIAAGLDAAIDRLRELGDDEGCGFVKAVLDEHCLFDDLPEDK